MPTLYFVQVTGSEKRLVESANKRAAYNFVAPAVTIEKAKAADIAAFMSKGGKVEVAA